MSTPRVTVPVELAERIKSFLLQAREDRKNSGRTKQALEINTMLHGLITAPAAPAPEGGAVMKALDEALIYIEKLGANIERNDLDMHLDTVERPFSFAQTMRGRFPSLCAAPATREEAPAEAGEPKYFAAFMAEDGALRAQPPAREDAQPVAWRRALSPIDGHFTYSNVGDEGWEPLYTHPAPDALRVAVEAFMPTNIDLTNTNLRDDQVLPCDVTVGELRAISAALQAEQKGGA